jgi:hypothetical protein
MDSTALSSASEAMSSVGPEASADTEPSTEIASLLSVEDVQKYLNRSRASVYRYANTDAEILNPPYDPKKLNPEVRRDKDAALKFRPQEVQRFAEEVLGLNPTIRVQTPEDTVTQGLMREILQELKAIHQLLKTQKQPPEL